MDAKYSLRIYSKAYNDIKEIKEYWEDVLFTSPDEFMVELYKEMNMLKFFPYSHKECEDDFLKQKGYRILTVKIIMFSILSAVWKFKFTELFMEREILLNCFDLHKKTRFPTAVSPKFAEGRGEALRRKLSKKHRKNTCFFCVFWIIILRSFVYEYDTPNY